MTKNDVQNVHRQPAHKLTNDDATDESLLRRHNDVIIGHSIVKVDKKNIYPPACLVHCDGACQKYEIRCKIICNIRTIRVAPVSGQCNLRFLSTKVLQGSLGTYVNYSRIFIDYFTANLLQIVIIKEFRKSVRISRSYRQKYIVAPFFRTRCINGVSKCIMLKLTMCTLLAWRTVITCRYSV